MAPEAFERGAELREVRRLHAVVAGSPPVVAAPAAVVVRSRGGRVPAAVVSELLLLSLPQAAMSSERATAPPQQAATRSCVHVPVSFVCWGTEAKVRRPGDRSCGVGWTGGEREAKGE